MSKVKPFFFGFVDSSFMDALSCHDPYAVGLLAIAEEIEPNGGLFVCPSVAQRYETALSKYTAIHPVPLSDLWLRQVRSVFDALSPAPGGVSADTWSKARSFIGVRVRCANYFCRLSSTSWSGLSLLAARHWRRKFLSSTRVGATFVFSSRAMSWSRRPCLPLLFLLLWTTSLVRRLVIAVSFLVWMFLIC